MYSTRRRIVTTLTRTGVVTGARSSVSCPTYKHRSFFLTRLQCFKNRGIHEIVMLRLWRSDTHSKYKKSRKGRYNLYWFTWSKVKVIIITDTCQPTAHSQQTWIRPYRIMKRASLEWNQIDQRIFLLLLHKPRTPRIRRQG